MHSLMKDSIKQQEICLNLKSNDNSAQSTVQINSYDADFTNDNHYLLVPILFLSLDVSALSKLMLAQFVELIKNGNDINLTYASLEKMFNKSRRTLFDSLSELKQQNLICVTEYRSNRTKHFSIKINFQTLRAARQEAMQKHSFFTSTNVNQCLYIPKTALQSIARADTLLTSAFILIFDRYYMQQNTLEKIVGTNSYIVRRVLKHAKRAGILQKSVEQNNNCETFDVDHSAIKRQHFFTALADNKENTDNVNKNVNMAESENKRIVAKTDAKTALDKALESQCKASLSKALRESNLEIITDDVNKNVNVAEYNNTYKDLNTNKNLTNYACAKKLDSYELAEISDAVKASTERIISNEVLQDDAVVTMQTLAEAFAVNPLHEQIRDLLHDNPTIQDDKYQSRYHRALLNVIADSHDAPLRAIRYHEARDYIHRTAAMIASHSSWSPSSDYHEFKSSIENNKPLDYSLKVTAKELKHVVTTTRVPEIFDIMLDAENVERPRHLGYELSYQTMHKFLDHYSDCSSAPKTIEQFGWAFEKWCERENNRMVVA